MGSEMCIRDRYCPIVSQIWYWRLQADVSQQNGVQVSEVTLPSYSEFLNIFKTLFEAFEVFPLLLNSDRFLKTVRRSYSNWFLPKAEQIMLHLVVAITKHAHGLRDASLWHLQHSLKLLPCLDNLPVLTPAPPKTEKELDETRVNQGETLSRQALKSYDQAWCRLQKLQVLGLLSLLLRGYGSASAQDVATYAVSLAAEQNLGQSPDAWPFKTGTWEKDMMEMPNRISVSLTSIYRAVACQ